MNNFTQFRVRHSSRLSIDDKNLFYIGMVQALEQDTFPDHAGCSGYDWFNFHEFCVCRHPPVLPHSPGHSSASGNRTVLFAASRPDGAYLIERPASRDRLLPSVGRLVTFFHSAAAFACVFSPISKPKSASLRRIRWFGSSSRETSQ